MCGRKKLTAVSTSMVFETPAGPIAIPKVKRIKCEACGEQFFDHQANRILDGYRSREFLRRKRRATTKGPFRKQISRGTPRLVR